MQNLIFIVVGIGASIADTLEAWTFALFGAVIALDVYVGLLDRRVLVFNVVQCVGLITGYFWTLSVFEQQDVAGPYAWAFVVGIWSVTAFLFHAWYGFLRFKMRSS